MNDVQLHNADCLDVLPALAGRRDIAVVTDPPYGIGYSHGHDSGVLAKTTRFAGVTVIGDDRPFDPTPFLAFPSVILWGANNYASRLPDKAKWLVWDKRVGLASNDLADCEMAWTNISGTSRLYQHRWMGMIKESERGQPRVHPMQKPVALVRWCLSFLPKGCTVFDPYMGSGTTGVACVQAGHSFIGCEVDPAYFATAQRRIAEAQYVPPLYVAAEQPIALFADDS